MVPGLLDLPEGCRFENRCTFSNEQCISNAPGLSAIKEQHQVSCLRWQEI
jgi:peptide/nickel transport system ATP-binding protein